MFLALRNERGNWSLIGLLVAVAIGVGIMAYFLMPGLLGSGTATGNQAGEQGIVETKPGQTVVGASIDQGKATQCMSNLRQIREWIVYTKTSGDPLPQTIEDMKLGSAARCPVSGQLYQYDPSTGEVKCTTPGHEGL